MGPTRHATIDIGVNLADTSFDKVRSCSIIAQKPTWLESAACRCRRRAAAAPPTCSLEYSQDREEVLQRARQCGVEAIVITGCCLRTSAAASELAEGPQGAGPALFFTAGVHPHNAKVRPVPPFHVH